MQIALNVAEGLEYLHHNNSTSCVHKDNKRNNTLLNSKFKVKIINFGFTKSGGTERLPGECSDQPYYGESWIYGPRIYQRRTGDCKDGRFFHLG